LIIYRPLVSWREEEKGGKGREGEKEGEREEKV
jgi:hypothetical protein